MLNNKIGENSNLKSALREMATNLNEAEFNLANGDYLILEHCRELRRQV